MLKGCFVGALSGHMCMVYNFSFPLQIFNTKGQFLKQPTQRLLTPFIVTQVKITTTQQHGLLKPLWKVAMSSPLVLGC